MSVTLALDVASLFLALSMRALATYSEGPTPNMRLNVVLKCDSDNSARLASSATRSGL